MQEKKYFPIKTATSCQLKWNWSTVKLYDGTTSSCHRVSQDRITPETFNQFHNTPKKIADRDLMLNGQWPQGGCEYCKNIEDAGGFSDRMFHSDIPNMYPPELELDPTATNVTPRILEVYFDNVCNMSCLYCWDVLSSKIHLENQKFGRFEKDGVIIDNTSTPIPNKDLMNLAFWQWLEENKNSIRRLHILGGEPFYQPQFEECLEFLEQHPCPELEFNVISNLKISNQKLKRFLNRIKWLVDNKHICRFDLTASIDCFGEEQEYVRYGIDLTQWKDNFQTVANEEWVYLNINQTLSVLTIKTVPELIKFINHLRSDREIGHYFSTVVKTHEFLHPGIFGPGFFSNDFDAILNEMPTITWQQQTAKKYMSGIKEQLETCERSNLMIKRLGIFLNEMDRRRNLNWRSVFPWLEREIKNVV